MSAKKKETVAPTEKSTNLKNDNVTFSSISEKQIVSNFDSVDKKDKNGNPFKLSRVIIPDEHSKNPLPKGSTIVVPSFLIMDDKFREGRKILKIEKDRDYQVDVKGSKSIKINGERLKEAFSIKPKEIEKNKTER